MSHAFEWNLYGISEVFKNELFLERGFLNFQNTDF